MLSINHISEINISYDDFTDLQAGTNCPVNEQEMKEFLQKAINAGILVKVSNPESEEVFKLILVNNQFSLTNF